MFDDAEEIAMSPLIRDIYAIRGFQELFTADGPDFAMIRSIAVSAKV